MFCCADPRRLATAFNDAAVLTYVGQQLSTLYGPPDLNPAPGAGDLLPLPTSTKLRPRLPVPPDAALTAAQETQNAVRDVLRQ